MPARIKRRLRLFVTLYLCFAYGFSLGAVSMSQEPDLAGLPWAQAMVGAIVAWIGGFAATLNRMVSASYDDKPFRHAHEFSKDGAVSVVIGLSGYWGGMANGMTPALLALILLLAGYGGTRTLSHMLNKIVLER